jgi:hypothetical protein
VEVLSSVLWGAQLKYGAMGYLDPNAGKSDLLAYLYGPSNAPSAPNARARNYTATCSLISSLV